MNEKKTLKVTTVAVALLVSSIMITIVSVLGLRRLYMVYTEVIRKTDVCIQFQKDAAEMREASDFLTDHSRAYVLTLDPAHAVAYFDEINVAQRREKALDNILTYTETNPAIVHLNEAFRESYELMYVEIHAMRLAAAISGAEQEGLPQELLDTSLLDTELNYSDQEKASASFQLVNDTNYLYLSESIKAKLDAGVEEVVMHLNSEQNIAKEALRAAILEQILCFALLIIIVFATFFHEYLMVIKTISRFADSIEAGEKIDEKLGSEEFQYLAKAYNNLADETLEQEKALRYQADHDPLTGLLNRNAMANLAEYFTNNVTSMALMIIDIDYFKNVNDTLGHTVGDNVLTSLAKLIKEAFGETDYIVRYGGDEFLVLLSDFHIEDKKKLEDKIDEINKALKKSHDRNLPKLSVSVGVAFSEHGYSWDLFRQADVALYRTKENGRSGISFYE